MNRIARLIVWTGTRPRHQAPRTTPEAYGCRYKDVHFPSACTDKVRLSGWLITPPGEPVGSVILCHGHTSTRTEMLGHAVMLSKHHFTTLLFDFRARGMSEGAHCTMGKAEQWDVVGALNYLQSKKEVAPAPHVLIGNSMGGAASVLAAAQDERAAAGEPKQRWIAGAAPHICAFRVYGKQYEEKVMGLLTSV